MSVTLSYRTPSRFNVKSKADLKLRDLLSLHGVGSLVTIGNLSGLSIPDLLIEKTLRNFESKGHLERLQGRLCSQCNAFAEMDIACEECGDFSGSGQGDEFAYRILSAIDRTSDSDWPLSKNTFDDVITVVCKDHSSTDVDGKIVDSEVRFSSSLENHFKNIDHFVHAGLVYYLRSCEAFRPEYASGYRHYSYEVTKKENLVMQNNSYIIGNSNTVNQSLNSSDSAAIELKAILERMSDELAKGGHQDHNLTKQIEVAKLSPKESMITKCKDIALTLQSALIILGTNGPELVSRFNSVLHKIIG